MERIEHVIGGEAAGSADGRTFESVDPYARQPWAQVALGGAKEAQAALEAARTAFDDGPWPRMTPAQRGDILRKLAGLLVANKQRLAEMDTRDMGKPIATLLGREVAGAAGNFRLFADNAQVTPSQAYPGNPGHHIYAQYAPAGVVAAIAPWNFPLSMATWKVAPALAYGNTVVLKPAEQSPASASLMAMLALEAGMPPGVLNVVHGFGPGGAGAALTSSPLVDRITFTGSTAVGSAIARAAAARLVPVSLECGGKGADIIFDDADLAVAIPAAARAIFTNSGQVCLVGSRLYVQRGVYEEVLAGLVRVAEGMRMGNPMDTATQLGPLASEEQYQKVGSYLASIDADGGRIVTGGAEGCEGWFVRPTIATGLAPSARANREEIFGPVLTVTPFDTEDEAVALANDSDYGLSALLFTRDLRRAHTVAEKLVAGTVWVNTFGYRDRRAPFGGARQSGIGREGGDFSREFFTEPKAIVMAY